MTAVPPAAVVFDLETTGLTFHPDAPLRLQPKIIEFGASLISLETGETIDECNIMIDPGEPISDEITKITGITNADLRGASSLDAALPIIRNIFADARTMVAHNLPFDRSVLRAELLRRNCTDFPWPKREMCTVGVYREEWGKNPRLIELYEKVLGRPLAQTHRALDDVKALLEIIRAEQLWRLM